MKAAVRTQYGPPEVLSVQEIDKPTPGDNEVLIRVHATTVNRTDCGILTGRPFIIRFFTGLRKPRSRVTGCDFAGEVEAVGAGVTAFKAGDRVWGFDDNGIPSHAEYLSFSADKAMTTIPEGISYAEAAASVEGAHYALNFINKVKLQPGSTVLVNGATGAIGSAAVQLLKYYGVEVTAVCDTHNLERVRALGADRVVDYLRDDFTQDDKQYDFVFDAVGKSSFGKCRRIMKPKGVYISSELGYMSQNPFLALITPLLGGRKVKFPVPLYPKKSILFMQELLEQGKFRPLIDRSYPLEDIAEAFRYVASGKKVGNVMIRFE